MRRFARISFGYLKNRKNYIQTKFVCTTTNTPAKQSLHLEWERTKETIFYNLINQQKRGYAPVNSTSAIQCWNCKKDQGSENHNIVCKECGYLQDVLTEINYFDLLEIPQTFALEAQTLTKKFRQLQTVVHPDKFSNKSSREQSNSADWSSLINKAYKTLAVPIDRGQYLLMLNGLQIPQDNSALDKEFLMEMMDRNEEVEDANTKEELNSINDSLNQELKVKVATLTKVFSENNLEAAKSLLVEMKYLISIQKTIKSKFQTLLGS